MRRIPYLLFFLVILLSACNNKDETLLDPSTDIPTTKKDIPAFNGQEKFDKAVNFLDTAEHPLAFSSLNYANDLGISKKVSGFGNQNGDIIKLQQETTYPSGQAETISYYFGPNGMICANRHFVHFSEKTSFCMDTKSYFDKNGAVIYTCKRQSDNEEKLLELPFTSTEKKNFSVLNAMEILNQKGPYATRLQGFMDAASKQFIIVGTKYYNSAIAYDPENKLIKKLKNKGDNALQTLLNVSFTEVKESNGFTYQGLLEIKIVPEK
jgi:hypothetical protein